MKSVGKRLQKLVPGAPRCLSWQGAAPKHSPEPWGEQVHQHPEAAGSHPSSPSSARILIPQPPDGLCNTSRPSSTPVPLSSLTLQVAAAPSTKITPAAHLWTPCVEARVDETCKEPVPVTFITVVRAQEPKLIQR